MRFKDKVVLVTGGSDGLGKGIAEGFLREGARVAVNGRNREKLALAIDDLCSRTGVGHDAVLAVAGDIGHSASVTAMFAQIVDAFGTLDVLINNAALTPVDGEGAKARTEFMKMMTTPIAKRSLQVTSQMSDERWLKMINTNLNGLFYCTRAALQVMEAKGYGKIVNVGSTAGISGLSAHSPHYAASKGGMVAFTKSVAVEVAGAGINVNCIAAGGVATEAWDTMFAKAGDGLRAQVMQMIPAGRLGTIDEYVSLALYLASDDAAYIMGQIISPNGGMIT